MSPRTPAGHLVIEAELDAALAGGASAAWCELEGARRDDPPPHLTFPPAFRKTLAAAITLERADGRTSAAATLVNHYTITMPRMRVAQTAGTGEPGATLFHTPLDWARLPRLSEAIDRLFALLVGAEVDPTVLGAATAARYRAATPTLAVLHARTHYGSFMPLLYGYPADLAYFASRGTTPLDVHATIDRYLTAPIIHELCHLAPGRDVRLPLHLDECIGGWLGVHLHPEFAFPATGEDDAIYAAPWLSQVGQAVARAFGLRSTLRTHAGITALPTTFIDAANRLGRDDWRARRTLHFLSDTFDPTPWIALALVGGAGRSLDGATLASLAATSLVTLAAELPDDPIFDRAVTEDALRAMCLATTTVDGSFRTRTVLPDRILIDVAACRVSTDRRSELDPVAPSYWLPPAVAARLRTNFELRLDSVTAIQDAAAALVDASTGCERDGFCLQPVNQGRCQQSLGPGLQGGRHW